MESDRDTLRLLCDRVFRATFNTGSPGKGGTRGRMSPEGCVDAVEGSGGINGLTNEPTPTTLRVGGNVSFGTGTISSSRWVPLSFDINLDAIREPGPPDEDDADVVLLPLVVVRKSRSSSGRSSDSLCCSLGFEDGSDFLPPPDGAAVGGRGGKGAAGG